MSAARDRLEDPVGPSSKGGGRARQQRDESPSKAGHLDAQRGPADPADEAVTPELPAPLGNVADEDQTSPDLAAAAALARARAAARDKGLRPGSRPLKRRRRPNEATYSGTGRSDGGRDPLMLGEQLDRLLVERGWNVDVSVGSVMGRWPAIVGADIARHCRPVTFESGVLVVRAESTAWATQLRYMSSSLLARLDAEAGSGVVTSLRIVGPSAPSWSKGPRRASGPGPRDTYG